MSLSTVITRQGEFDLPAIADLSKSTSGLQCFKLPPLILHPFSGTEDTSVLMESSRASLALQGFLPHPELSDDDLDKKLLRGRYAELRMLFYIGKDLMRWMEQCQETAVASGRFEGRLIQPETFAVFLIQHVPAHVRAKLEGWGVLDFCALFRRSIGMHGVFSELPAAEGFAADFLRRYHRHLDQWFEQRLRDVAFERPSADEFTFDLYASGEYTMMLEQSWGSEQEGA
jgi:hypothetical protein